MEELPASWPPLDAAMAPEVAAAAEMAPVGTPAGRSRRAAWSVLDQGLSSLTNFAVGIVVARSAAPRDFALFAIAFSVYLTVIAGSRAICTEPLVVLYSARSESDRRHAVGRATGAALLVGLTCALALAPLALFLPGTARALAAALALSMPGLLLQDAWRFTFFADARPDRAVLNDGAWACGQAVLFVAATLLDVASPATLLAAWGVAATVAALFGLLQQRVRPSLRLARGWFAETRFLGPRLLGDVMTTLGAQQITLYAVGWISGLEAMGAFRAAQLVLGPLTVVMLGASVAAVPEASRARNGLERLRPLLVRMSVALTLVGVTVALVALAVPAALGRAVLGETWAGTRPVLVPTALGLAAWGASMGAIAGLRALAAGPRIIRARLVVAPTGVLAGIAGASLWGATGAASGFALGNCIGISVWWHHFRAALREGARESR
jgi:O-antigen/teichoic acid export membrane protein